MSEQKYWDIIPPKKIKKRSEKTLQELMDEYNKDPDPLINPFIEEIWKENNRDKNN